MISLLWLRRDLRVHDQQALLAAAAGAEHLVPECGAAAGIRVRPTGAGPLNNPNQRPNPAIATAAT
ncbi:MAG: deoxyribodipyrimidine photo-lyase [Solirubrobacteraceae bacterium]